MTKLAWLNSTSYPGMWLMVAQGPVQGQGRERMMAVVFFFCTEGRDLGIACPPVRGRWRRVIG